MSLTLPHSMQCALTALRPILQEAVIIGGWAHRLHSLHPLAEARFEPLTTVDCDIALPLALGIPSGISIEERLRKAGFACVVDGNELAEHRRYVLTSDREFYVQFVTRRQGSAAAQPRMQELAGVLAEPLRDIDLALEEPWSTQLTLDQGVPVTVQIVRPSAFLIGKLLVAGSARRGEDRAKDLVYVSDTLLMFEDAIEDLRDEALGVLSSLSRSQRSRLRASLAQHLGARPSDSLYAAAEISSRAGSGRPADLARLRSVLRYGIRFLLGEKWLPPAH